MAEDGIISSRDEIFPVNSLVAYPCLGLFSPRNEEKIGRGDRLRAEENEREEEEEEEVVCVRARGPLWLLETRGTARRFLGDSRMKFHFGSGPVISGIVT